MFYNVFGPVILGGRLLWFVKLQARRLLCSVVLSGCCSGGGRGRWWELGCCAGASRGLVVFSFFLEVFSAVVPDQLAFACVLASVYVFGACTLVS
jgi:hypothetical protein